MRLLVLVSVCALSSAVLAGDLHVNDLHVKIVDPQAAVVPGAQVVLLREGSSVPVSVQESSGSGQVFFRSLTNGKYVVKVLAAGFGVQQESVEIPRAEELAVQLAIVSPVETVTVTAAGIAIPAKDSGAEVATLDASQLRGMQSIAAADALRFLPGVVINAVGRRGGQSSLFVRGGESRYNKILVDGVPVDDPGGFFDFGVTPLTGVDHIEFVRGAQSTLYGSDAMTSVVQVFTREGSTRIPELRFGAEGGTFGTARGYASLGGARGAVDYNLFGEQTNTSGQGINDTYSNSSEGGNIGFAVSQRVKLRLRSRHTNSFTGVPSEWDFNGQKLIPPDGDQRARQNTFLASADLSFDASSRWHHNLRGYEYHLRRSNIDDVNDPLRASPIFGPFDFPFSSLTNINQAGFQYQGEYWARTWARSTFGYEFQDENGFVGDRNSPPLTHGLRLNHAVYGQEILTLGRVSLVAGGRFLHNDNFGNKVVPRVAASLTVLRGGEFFSGTRLRFAYAEGIKEPRLEETFANSPPFVLPNLALKAEENRSYEAGVQQSLLGGKYSVAVNYYHNLFRDQITFASDPITFAGQYVNLNRSFAQGAEAELHGRLAGRVSLDAAYNYTSTQILSSPFAFDPLVSPGRPLLRRPKHSGSLLLNYAGSKWGGNLGGSFVGRRPDSDFLGFGFNHAAGYARVDVGGWYQVHSRVTAYVNVENALNKHYQEVVGYPALRANFRAGLRFRLGGE